MLHVCAHVHAWTCLQVRVACRLGHACRCDAGTQWVHTHVTRVCVTHVRAQHMCCGCAPCMCCVSAGVLCVYVVCVQVPGQHPRDHHIPPSPAPILCPGTCPMGALEAVGPKGWAGMSGAPGLATSSGWWSASASSAQRGICHSA